MTELLLVNPGAPRRGNHRRRRRSVWSRFEVDDTCHGVALWKRGGSMIQKNQARRRILLQKKRVYMLEHEMPGRGAG